MTYNTEKTAEIKRIFSTSRERAYSAREICELICPDGRGKSTVFRIIAKLAEEGSIKKITDKSSRHVCYQYLGQEGCSMHLHLKCKDCGMLIHLDEKTSHMLEENLLSSKGFLLEEGSMLFGKCNACRAGGDRR